MMTVRRTDGRTNGRKTDPYIALCLRQAPQKADTSSKACFKLAFINVLSWLKRNNKKIKLINKYQAPKWQKNIYFSSFVLNLIATLVLVPDPYLLVYL